MTYMLAPYQWCDCPGKWKSHTTPISARDNYPTPWIAVAKDAHGSTGAKHATFHHSALKNSLPWHSHSGGWHDLVVSVCWFVYPRGITHPRDVG